MTTSKIHPVRLQLSRVKGARLVSPNGLPIVSVVRPGRWGNQWIAERRGKVWVAVRVFGASEIVSKPCDSQADATRLCVASYRADLFSGQAEVTVGEVREFLLNKNLACWCKLGAPCHADTLLCVARGIYQ